MKIALSLVLPVILTGCVTVTDTPNPSRGEVLGALSKATAFFVDEVASSGGYQAAYSPDLQFARSSKGAHGRQQISATPSATPTVGLALLDAWEASGDLYYLDSARTAGKALLLGQLCSGGWDYTTFLEPEKRKKYDYRADGCPEGPAGERIGYTNLDNNNTTAALRFLMRLDRELEFRDPAIHEGVQYAFAQLLRAQYPNGAWPQRYSSFVRPEDYPVKRAGLPDGWSHTWPGYIFYGYYTFNDDCIANMIDVLFEAARIYKNPKYLAAAEKGGEFILLAQLPEPQPSWAQQYNAEMHPAWARPYEPPAVCSREAVTVMRTLLLLYRETGKKRYLEPIPKAVAYLKASSWIRESDGKRVMARFYEMGTNKPLYFTKGDRISSPPLRALMERNLKAHGLDRRAMKMWRGAPNGYEVTYSDKSVVGHYSFVIGAESLDDIQAEYERYLQADPVTLRRPDRLDGITAVAGRRERSKSQDELAPAVREAIDALDERGAWVGRGGNPGGPAQVVSIRPASEMVVVVGDQVIPLPETETLEVYRGSAPPKNLSISSGHFAQRVRVLADYLRAK